MRGLVNVLARRSLVVEDEAVKRRIGAMGKSIAERRVFRVM